MQRLLAQPHRRVGVHAGNADAVRNRVGLDGHDVRRAGSYGIAGAEIEGAAIHVDGPDGGIGAAECQRDGDRTVPAPHVHEVAGRWGRDGLQQQIGTEIDMTVREHSAIRFELEGEVGEGEARRPGV